LNWPFYTRWSISGDHCFARGKSGVLADTPAKLQFQAVFPACPLLFRVLEQA
jgi:hypothetical protein